VSREKVDARYLMLDAGFLGGCELRVAGGGCWISAKWF